MADWWFGTWIWWLSIQLAISSSQLTFTPSFFRGAGLNHQPAIVPSTFWVFFCVSCRFRFDDPGVWFSGWMSKTVRSDWFTDSEWSKICGGSQRFAFPFWTWSLGQTSATKNHFKAGKHLVLLVGPGSDFNASWIFYGLNQGWIPMDIELRWIKRVETCSSSKNWHLPRLMKWAVELLSSPSGP